MSDEKIYIDVWSKMNYTTMLLEDTSDKRVFYKVDQDKRRKFIESGKPGYCFQQNFGLFVDKFNKFFSRAGIKHTSQLRDRSRWVLDMSLMRFKTHTGINHCAVVYTQGGVKYLEDRSNAIHKKIRYETWLDTNQPTEVEELDVRLRFEDNRVFFRCAPPVNLTLQLTLH